MELLNFIRGKMLALGAGRSRAVAVGLLILGLGAVIGALFTPSTLTILLGSMAGLLWFVALDTLWIVAVPRNTRDRIDLRGDRPLAQRRMIAGGLLVLWFIVAIVTNNQLLQAAAGAGANPSTTSQVSPLLGALTVVMALIAFRIGSATETERESEEMAYDKWLERQQRKRSEKKQRSTRWYRKRDTTSASDEDA